jgi:ribonuclease BN (tRNA processing enzyme)
MFSSSNDCADAAAMTVTSNRATQIVMLGTGTPMPDPNRSGPSTAIIVGNTPYLIDFGPGVVRRAAAAYRNGLTALGHGAVNITTAFLTHLHSDHTLGYPDLIFTPWVMGRKLPLTVYGPPGLKAMTENIMKAWTVDIEARANGRHNATGYRVNAHEIGSGIIYEDRNLTVTAFAAHHSEMKDSFGYRFEASDRTIVISGDSTPTQAIIDHSHGCDVLIHECYSLASYEKVSPEWQNFRRTHHTSSRELAEIAMRVNPGLLVLYHRSNAGGGDGNPNAEQEVIDEVRQFYQGAVVTGHDLDVF